MPFSIHGRKDQAEGWEVDVDSQSAKPGRRERLANNSVLWIACALVVLMAGLALISVSGDESAEKAAVRQVTPGDVVKGEYGDEAHLAFVERLVAMEKRRGMEIDAEFISDSELKVVVPADSGDDEIAYVSRFAALGIKRRFNNRSWIYVYARDSKKPDQLKQVATTSWNEREHNYVTKTDGLKSAE